MSPTILGRTWYCKTTFVASKALMQRFATSIGLKVNFHKSCMVPINVRSNRIPLLTGVFGCLEGRLPFRYLGIPLGTTKPLVKDYAPLFCRTKRKLSASLVYLPYSRRATDYQFSYLSLNILYVQTQNTKNSC